MTATIAEACADLAAWIPVAAGLVAEPDITASSETRSAPGSAPPWNPQAAAAFYDIKGIASDVEQELRHAVTGRPAHLCRRKSSTDGATLKALDAIPKLAAAADEQIAASAATQLANSLMRLLQLPAIDVEDRIRRPDAPCPRCRQKKIRYYEREFILNGRLACFGCTRSAILTVGKLSGDAFLTWDDGEITVPPEGIAA